MAKKKKQKTYALDYDYPTKLYAGNGYYLYFKRLTKEEQSIRQSRISKHRKTFGGTKYKGKKRPASSIATKKQWQDPKFRELMEIKRPWDKIAYMKKPYKADAHSWDKRNELMKKVKEKAEKLGIDTNIIGANYLKDEELKDLYYKLSQW